MADPSSTNARLGYAALAVAALALVASLYSLTLRPAPESAPPASCADCEDVRRELSALQASVKTLRDKVAMLQAANASAPGAVPPPPPSAGADASAEPPPEHPKFVTFEKLDPSLTVAQADDGSLTVVGAEPKLSGKRVTFVGVTEDGERREVSVVVR